jgi:hypothetical protein
MVNCMGIDAASARHVGLGDHVEAMLSPSVGCLRLMVAVHTNMATTFWGFRTPDTDGEVTFAKDR